MQKLIWIVFMGMGMMANAYILIDYETITQQEPTISGKNVRVWSVHKTDIIRINLVEFTGELALHKHPDADHSLVVLEGKVRVQVGDEQVEIEKGDFISVPADMPHKYWTLSDKAMLMSMDAPYYDPQKTVVLE